MKLTSIVVTIIAVLVWQSIGFAFAYRRDKGGWYTSPAETAITMALGGLVPLLALGVWVYDTVPAILYRIRSALSQSKEG